MFASFCEGAHSPVAAEAGDEKEKINYWPKMTDTQNCGAWFET